MSDNVSEYILERLLTDWGVQRIFGYAGDGIIGFLGAMRGEAGVRSPPLRAGPPRGDGGVHGLRARQVHRRGGRVHGDLRARRHSSAQRAL